MRKKVKASTFAKVVTGLANVDRNSDATELRMHYFRLKGSVVWFKNDFRRFHHCLSFVCF